MKVRKIVRKVRNMILMKVDLVMIQRIIRKLLIKEISRKIRL